MWFNFIYVKLGRGLPTEKGLHREARRRRGIPEREGRVPPTQERWKGNKEGETTQKGRERRRANNEETRTTHKGWHLPAGQVFFLFVSHPYLATATWCACDQTNSFSSTLSWTQLHHLDDIISETFAPTVNFDQPLQHDQVCVSASGPTPSSNFG